MHDTKHAVNEIPLRNLADAAGLAVGAAVDLAVLDGTDRRYPETLEREFNCCVAENAFKPSEVWIGPRAYNFAATDRLADFAVAHGMLLRGHTLVWHQQTPRWLDANNLPPAEILCDLLRDYIHTLVGRYRGRVAHWDVVNEVVTDPDRDSGQVLLRADSPWMRALGPDYLSQAFTWAHEADPNARLYYNDYEIEGLGPKSDAAYQLLQDLLSAGVPVHGIGYQGHLLNGWRATDTVRANIRRFADLGLEWAVTEADIRMQLDGNPPSPEQLVIQADGFRDLTHLCRSIPGCRALVFWGFTDAHSWISGFRKGWGAALPLDNHYLPKPAYHAVSEALR